MGWTMFAVVNDDAEEKTHTTTTIKFKDYCGKLGAAVDDGGKIINVKDAGAANKYGLLAGWTILQLDGKPFSSRRLRRVLQAPKFKMLCQTSTNCQRCNVQYVIDKTSSATHCKDHQDIDKFHKAWVPPYSQNRHNRRKTAEVLGEIVSKLKVTS